MSSGSTNSNKRGKEKNKRQTLKTKYNDDNYSKIIRKTAAE